MPHRNKLRVIKYNLWHKKCLYDLNQIDSCRLSSVKQHHLTALHKMHKMTAGSKDQIKENIFSILMVKYPLESLKVIIIVPYKFTS